MEMRIHFHTLFFLCAKNLIYCIKGIIYVIDLPFSGLIDMHK